jgi:hypothetical protein
LEHIACLPGMGTEVDEILKIHPWPTTLTKDAMRRVYLLIAGYCRDIPEKWVYIRRDYRLEDEPEVDPRAGELVVKNADVKIVKQSCIHTLNTRGNTNQYDTSGNCFYAKTQRHRPNMSKLPTLSRRSIPSPQTRVRMVVIRCTPPLQRSEPT